MGTLVVSNVVPQSAGSEVKVEGKFTIGGDGLYVSGGLDVIAKSFGLTQINRLLAAPTIDGVLGGVTFAFDSTSNKLAFVSGGGGGGLAFNGNPMATHSHDLDGFTHSSVLNSVRMYLAAVAGGPPAPGDTVTGAAGSANVLAYVGDAGYVTVDTVVGAFAPGEGLAFAPSGATANIRGNLVHSWVFIPALNKNTNIVACANQDGIGLQRTAAVFGLTQALGVSQYRFYQTLASLETNYADGVTTVYLEGSQSAVSIDSAGTPTGAIVGGGGTFDEIANGTNVAALEIPFEAYGYF